MVGGFGGPRAARSADESLAVTELGSGLLQITGAGGNIVLISTPDGAMMVDSGSAASSQALLELVAKQVGDAGVHVLFNTHWHLDHTGGNDAIAEREVAIVAHENTRLWMSTKFYVDWEDRRYSPRRRRPSRTRPFFPRILSHKT